MKTLMAVCLLASCSVFAQPRSKPEPTPWARPTPTPKPRTRSYNPTVARKQEAETKKARELDTAHGSYEHKVVNYGDIFTEVSWKVGVINAQGVARDAFIQVQYLDAEGFAVDEVATIQKIQPGYYLATDTKNIRAADWPRIAKARVKIEWMD